MTLQSSKYKGQMGHTLQFLTFRQEGLIGVSGLTNISSYSSQDIVHGRGAATRDSGSMMPEYSFVKQKK
jgi:hypothetical protein